MVLEHKRFDLFNKMIFEKAVMVPPFRLPSNMPNEACFLYVLEGSQQTISANEKLILKSKDAILMNCGLYYTEWLTSTDYEKCEAIAVHLYPEVLKKVYENDLELFFSKASNSNQIPQSYIVKGNEMMDAYIQSLIFYFNNPNLLDEELIKLKLKELILLLLKTEKASSVKELISSMFSPRTYKFKEVISSNLYSNITVDELAQFTNLSTSSFKREFLKIYNESPAKYLRNKKIARASELLLNNELRISDIAFECGFNDAAHLSKTFQEILGISPSQYRLNQNGKSLD